MRYFLAFSAVLVGLFGVFHSAAAQNTNASNFSLPSVQPYNGSTLGASRRNSAQRTDNDGDGDYDRYDQDIEEQSPAAETTYQMDENGFLVPMAGQAAKDGEIGAPKQAVAKKENNPNKQVYKGGKKKPLVAPHTHRMYEDNHY